MEINIECKIIEMNKPTKNNRIYDEKAFHDIIHLTNEKIKNNECIGGLVKHFENNQTLTNLNLQLNEVAFKINSIDQKNNKLNCNIQILHTPNGKFLQEYIDENGIENLSLSPFCVLNHDNKNPVKIYGLIRFDLILMEN